MASNYAAFEYSYPTGVHANLPRETSGGHFKKH